jgi:hypothetical protein
MVIMACPFFREDYFGFCGAVKRLYVPSISKMEQHCFKIYGKCRTFIHVAYSAVAAPDTSAQGSVARRGPLRSQLTFVPDGDTK